MSRFPDRWRWPLATLGIVVVAAGAFLIVDGLGDSGGKSTAERELEGAEGGEGGLIKDPVKRRYVERANEICAETQAKWTAAAREIFGGATRAGDADLREYLDRVIPSLRQMIEELRRVPAKPPGDEARIVRYYARMERVVGSLERLRRHPGSERLRNVADTYGVGFLKNMAAQNYGLEICGQED